MRERVVTRDGSTIAYQVHGVIRADAPALLLIPGWLCKAQTWSGTARRLSSRVACVTIDLPGVGASQPGGRRSWTMRDYALDIIAVIRAEALGNTVLVGHSMGGAVALEALLLLPDEKVSVVAVESLIHSAIYDLASEPVIERTMDFYRGDFASAIWTGMQPYMGPGGGDPDIVAAVRDMARSDPAIGRALFEDLLRWDVDAVLARVGRKVPLIYSQGLVAPESVRRWSRIARLMPVASSSHFPMLDAPHEMDDALLEAVRVADAGSS